MTWEEEEMEYFNFTAYFIPLSKSVGCNITFLFFPMSTTKQSKAYKKAENLIYKYSSAIN
jgi:hypothetical protein